MDVVIGGGGGTSWAALLSAACEHGKGCRKGMWGFLQCENGSVNAESRNGRLLPGAKTLW